MLILAAGTGQRLNGQPKAFLSLAGETLLERVARLGGAFSTSVIAAVPASDLDRGTQLLGDAARVIPGGASLADTFHALVEAASAPRVMLLDVAHPLASRGLCARVLAAAGDGDAAVAVGRTNDQVLAADGSAIGAPGSHFLLQKPIVFPLPAIRRGIAARSERKGGSTRRRGVLELLRLAGVTVHMVESEPWNLKLTTEQDWLLVRLLADRLAEAEGPS